MRPLLFFAAALVLIGGYVARYADNAIEHRADAQAAVVQPSFEPREPSSSGRSLMLEADRQGHFEVEARVEGRFIDFIVDTGASLVVLRESAAAQAGIRPQLRDYTATAVYDVPAIVLPDEALAKNLLGVSFLSRLKRYEYANGRLVLEQ